MKKKSAIYVRVSTNYQVDKDSLPLQRQDLINYSKYVLGINDYEIFEDAGFSGKNTSRPAFQDMMQRIKNREFSHLLVWKIDRISRNLLDFCNIYEEIKKYDCTFVSKNEQFDTSSAMGEAMLKIILVFAELERKLTGERVTAVMLDRAQKGLWNGAPMPLGYKWDNEKKFPGIDDEEAKTITLIYNNYKKLKSSSYVRNFLNASGIKTKRNGTWTTKTITDIIRNPFYKGTYRYNYRENGRGKKKKENEWILLDDNHPGIVSKELWQECNDLMDINAQKNTSWCRTRYKTHIFTSLVNCGECGHTFHAKEDKANKDGYIPSLYWCSGRYNNLGCSQKTISDKIVGTFVLKYISNITNLNSNTKFEDIEKILLNGKPFENVLGIEDSCLNKIDQLLKIKKTNIFTTGLNDISEKNNFEFETLKKEKEKFERATKRLDDLYLFDDEAISEKDYILKKNNLKSKLDEINNKMNEFNIETSDLDLTNMAKIVLLTLELKKENEINYKYLVQRVGKEMLKELMNSVINKITVKDRKVTDIEFKNGLISTFIYTD